MDSLKRRNPPETPKTEKFDAEILPSPYRRGMQWRVLFELEQQPKRTNDHKEAAALEILSEREARMVLFPAFSSSINHPAKPRQA